MSKRKIFGVEVPINEKMLFSFSTDDALITNLDYQDAILRCPFTKAVSDDLRKIDIQFTPASLDHWMVNGKGKYVGTWAKRLSKYVKDRYSYNINMEHLSVLSEHLSKALKAVTVPYYIEFTDHANWKAGDFADSGSCWFDGRHTSTRAKMIRAGGGAVLIYHENGQNKGRLWYYPLDGGNFSAIFNIYDFQNQLTILGMARIISMKFGVQYMRAHTLYFPDAYINGEGSAYIVGTNLVDRPITLTFAQERSAVEYIDGFNPFGLGTVTKTTTSVPNNKHWTCCLCEEEYNNNQEILIDGESHCLECLEDNDNYIQCADCDKWSDYDSSYYVEFHEKRVCEPCFNEDYTTCNDCGNIRHNNNINNIQGDNVCDTCRDENYFECTCCQELRQNGDQRTATGDRSICDGCADEHFELCAKCTDYEETDDTTGVTVRNNEERWCANCCEKYEDDIHVCPDCDIRYYRDHDCEEAQDD